MAVTFTFLGAPPPLDVALWQAVAASVFGPRQALVVVERRTNGPADGWSLRDVRVFDRQGFDAGAFAVLPNLASDEAYEELLLALIAAQVLVRRVGPEPE